MLIAISFMIDLDQLSGYWAESHNKLIANLNQLSGYRAESHNKLIANSFIININQLSGYRDFDQGLRIMDYTC